MANERRIKKATGVKRDKPTITKSQLERLVSLRPKDPSTSASIYESKPSLPSPSPTVSAPFPAEDVATVRPTMQKPSFDFAALKASSSLLSSLPSFLSEMEKANRELEEERKAGTLGQRKLEIDDDETSTSGSSSDSSDDDDDSDEEMGDAPAEKGKKVRKEKEPKQYIEMNLGLGVLEEKGDESSSDESSSSEESEEEDVDGEVDVMGRLQGKEKKEVGTKRVGIEVVKESC